jgi:hypothetical protein
MAPTGNHQPLVEMGAMGGEDVLSTLPATQQGKGVIKDEGQTSSTPARARRGTSRAALTGRTPNV